MSCFTQHYEPLPGQERYDADSSSSEENKSLSARRQYHNPTFFVSLGLNVALLLALVLQTIKYSSFTEWKGAKPVYTPAKNILEHELVRFKKIRHETTRFDGPPSDEVDKAWKELYDDSFSAISKSEAAPILNGTEIFTGDEEHYIVQLDVFHQLHCLNFLRRGLWPEYYPSFQENRHSALANGDLFDHADHCINSIRESLQCSGDLTPVTWHWDEQRQVSNLNFNELHTCVNWDAIMTWKTEHKEHIAFDQFHHVADDLVFPVDSLIL